MPANRTDRIWAVNLTVFGLDTHIDTKHQCKVLRELSTADLLAALRITQRKPEVEATKNNLRRGAPLVAGRYLWRQEKC